MKRKKLHVGKSKETQYSHRQIVLIGILAFLLGCCVSFSIVINSKVAASSFITTMHDTSMLSKNEFVPRQVRDVGEEWVPYELRNCKTLVAIAAYDFSQIPHLEEVLDAYHDLAVAGAIVDVVVHATVAYPVTLIDLWNTRFTSNRFSVTICIQRKSLQLHLVDLHRALFYKHINDYDLFIYSEEDIRVTPSVVATYLSETKRIAEIAATTGGKYKPSDFNVGIVRYEYNFPANVVIDDNTRHATMNVTRVYWEHSGYVRPVVPNALKRVKQMPFDEEYVTMSNAHQGMFLATRELLFAWKDREGCNFDQARQRPGKHQPTEGTQRVWMSSRMLFGSPHCGVQQVIPRAKFGALTVWHLPNKNYRRVGHFRNRTFSGGSELLQQPHGSLLSAMELHLGMYEGLGSRAPQFPYTGIRMVDQIKVWKHRSLLLDRRMREYEDYVKRGGVFSPEDVTKTALMEDE
jgi:hypothetical protein